MPHAQLTYFFRKDAAKALGMSIATFDRRVKDGHIKPDRVDPVSKRPLWLPDIAERYYEHPEGHKETMAERGFNQVQENERTRRKLQKQPNQ